MAKFLNFPTPHCHQQSLDTGSTPKAFAERELELETGTMTVTDHGTLSACRIVYDLAKKKKLTPILGLEGYFRDDNCPILNSFGITDVKEYAKYFHITMHAMDQDAYHALVRVLSRADDRAEVHGAERKPLFDWKDLEELGSYNITMTSGCLIGMVQRHIIHHERGDIAQAYYERLKAICKPGNFYVEIFPHRCDKNWVSGIFLNLEDGSKIKVHSKKKLEISGLGQVEAESLIRKKFKDEKLLAIKNYQTWEPNPNQPRIITVEKISDFLPNECKPWCPDGDVQLGANRVVRALAAKYGDKILISDDSHYAHPDEKIVQEIRLSNIGDNFRFYGSYHRQSSDEAYEYFKTYMKTSEKDFEQWIDNAREWADKFKNFKFNEQVSLPTKFYPNDTLRHTYELIVKHGRLDSSKPEYVQRLKDEIELLHFNGKVDLLPYFFIGEEVCSLYRDNSQLTGPGRGSAAGLLLSYLLGITHVDPIRFDLSKERFLTLDRIKSGKLPDIDQDLPNRDLLVGDNGFLQARFGDHFAQISVDTTLKLKSSIKDVFREKYGKVPENVEALCKKMQTPPQGISDDAFVYGYDNNGIWVPGSIDTDQALKEFVSTYPQEWEVVQKCLGIARQKSRHACAYVIANEPISNFIPLTTVTGVKVTQYTAKSVEAAGGLKMDFLCLNTLVDIGECLKIIQHEWEVANQCHMPPSLTLNGVKVPQINMLVQNGQFLDIWDLPPDQAVFKDVFTAKTETVFQFNTSGAQKYLPLFWDENRTYSIMDMADFTALDRPGPLDAYVTDLISGTEHNMLVEYTRRLKGQRPIGNISILDQLLPETNGIIVYQEQVQKIFQKVGNTTASEADEFRVHVSKKMVQEVIKDKEIFMRGAVAMAGQADADAAWGQIETYMNYGFNKSHAVCYAHIAYASAYLKHHFPLQWWTAVLRNAAKDEIDTKFWRYCGHLVDLPDIAKSGPLFEIQNGRIRAPISMLHGIGETAHKQLVQYAPYTNIEDFVKKTLDHRVVNATFDKNGKMKKGHNALNRKVVYTMIVGGVMNDLFPPGSTTLEMLGLYEEAIAKIEGKKLKGVDPFYKDITALTKYQIRKEILPAWTEDIWPMIITRKVPDLIRTPPYGVEFEKNKFNPSKGITEKKLFKWEGATGAQLDQLSELSFLPPSGVKCSVAAYVILDRRFGYGPSKEKKAAALTVDVEGSRFEFVCWQNRDGGLLPVLEKNDLTGAVVVLQLSRWDASRPFGIDNIIVVELKPEKKSEQSPDTE